MASSRTPTREDLQALSAFYYDVAASRLEAQLDSIDNIDSKSTSFFTIGSTVLPVVGGFLASDRSPSLENEVARTFLLLGFVAYLLLALCYVWSFRTARWERAVDLDQLQALSSEFAVEDLQRTLADACVRSHADNEVRIRNKAQWSAMAMWFLFAEATLLTVAVLIPMFPAG